MSNWTGEKVFEGLEKWLKTRRDEASSGAEDYRAEIIDMLLDEVRDKGVEGWLPWQNL